MDEPDLDNRSDFASASWPIVDREGKMARVVVIKASFSLDEPDGQLVLAQEPNPLRLGDEFWGKPEVPDVRLPADYGLEKVGTDFILSACATPMQGRQVTYVDVGLRVADRSKVLRVHGPRQWRRGLLGVVPGPSALVTQGIPLSWSRAWGGQDMSDPSKPLEEARNPIGSGVIRDPARLIGLPAPQIEAPDEPIGEAGGKCLPQGFAALAPHFAPRRDTAGTYDQDWLDKVYPAKPADYKPEHENRAPVEFQFGQGLRGGEPVQIAGVHATRHIEFVLPKWLVRVRALIDGQVQDKRPQLDTVVVDAQRMQLEMVWRAIFTCPPRMRNRFTTIRVEAKEFVS
ncbi:MAG: DUF2169 domain-containing protein [Burkholderiales bacterium]|nr:MAG: DUF2169 domain-containing protein [Burkholderiales bacterium]